ncbi:site-specific integrase [Synechococcus elongatus]|uniref:Phage integrase n=2 Tax=Synechococcus elongatus TaxID=32046 RepID=Q31S01_SYNE7|nr:site-specific integrase [Synechococcus elongatus]ABB56168.1 phage integrase [Synechococcus elongatus PCC 7942 = FACHB-805]AJD56779.1 integrase [Synechococcus elongatus UTEX 2973]MBD2588000.1 site-specific integrase [Synechococcus elongatus FACHB-242]MBD2689068.1 site-specific integrase [Synechococcus elongatus FACHB-1061]MBD2707292.1 site-specific integrase [Synechococcus elongatus PCC 7942 = FACHB-805]
MPRSRRSAFEIATAIAQANERFRLAGLRLRIEQRGDCLGLRGQFPPKPGSDRDRPHQQRLSLGLPPTAAGLREAERQLKIVAGLLLQDRFDWTPYLVWSREPRLKSEDLAAAIWQFEQQFFQDPQRSQRPASTETTWRSAYQPYLRRLQAIAQQQPREALSDQLLATLASYPANSRSAQLCITALKAFAAWLDLDLPELPRSRLSYGAQTLQPRQLPSDAEILQAFDRIPNPAWRFVFGVMATYGLRNHEVFFADYSALTQGDPEAVLRVLSTTKTGEHDVWPFLPDWVEQFDLRRIQLPAIATDLNQTTLQRIGQRVTQQFRRYNLPFSPYDLRHAWAVRTIHLGLPDAVAAKMMGHSIAIHTRTYQRWIGRRDQQRAVADTLARWRDRDAKSGISLQGVGGQSATPSKRGKKQPKGSPEASPQPANQQLGFFA